MGWLIVEDIAMILVLVLLPVASRVSSATWSDAAILVALALGKVALFIGLMLAVGARFLPWLLNEVVRSGSRELFTIAVVASAIGIAFGATKLFDVSLALGAFFAGVVVNASDHSHRAAADLQPLEDAFAGLFFVSVGMLFDPAILLHQPLDVLSVLAIIVVGKSAVTYAVVRLFGYTTSTALTVAASLAQIGEFSFILAGLGVALHVLPEAGRGLIVAGALISIAMNPLMFRLARRFGGSKPIKAR